MTAEHPKPTQSPRPRTQDGNTLSRRAAGAGGQPISDLMSRALAHPELISLAAGFVDQATLPAETTSRALAELLADPAAARAALQYGTTSGYPKLRGALLSRYLAGENLTASQGHLSVEQVILTAGSNQLLYLVAEVLLDPGDIVLCTAPTYFVFLGAVHSVGGRSMSVETDEQGILPEALEERLAHLEKQGELSRVKAIYLVTYFDNPRGVTLPADRRQRVVEIAKRWSRDGHRIHLIEDAAYRKLRYEGADVPSLRTFDEDGDTVIVAGTFSKSYSPGIRVGWGMLPHHLVGPVCDLKGNIDFGSPNFNQHLMAHVVESGKYDEHVTRISKSYREKMHAMLGAADEHMAGIPGVSWIRPQGGLYVWLTVPEGIDTGPAGPLFNEAVRQGVLYVPGEYCHPREGLPPRRHCIRLSFGVQSCEGIALGMQALARAIKRVTERG
jgi:2-aminoadipate transaminase